MTPHRLTQLDHVSQLLNVRLRTFHEFIDHAVSELDLIQSSFKHLMFLYEKLEEENEHHQILKEFNKTLL